MSSTRILGVTGQGLFYTGGVPELGPWAGWYAGSGQAGTSNSKETKALVAINRIHHEARRLSYIELPVRK